jgi:hypothetical protein
MTRTARDPEAPIGNAETSQWRCGCGTEVPKRHVAAMRAAVRVTLDRYSPQTLFEPAIPLYCEACGKFVGWTHAPESSATLNRERRLRWLAETLEFGRQHAVGLCVEALHHVPGRRLQLVVLRAHIAVLSVRAWLNRDRNADGDYPPWH